MAQSAKWFCCRVSKPITARDTTRYADVLPAEVDVVVIGGGVIGVFTALYAVRKGLSVALLEKGLIAGEQSSRNWGWLRQQGRDAAEVPIVMQAIRLWKEVDEQTGGKTGFTQGGTSYLASTPSRLDDLMQWLPIAEQHGLDTQALSQAELGRVVAESTAGARWCGAIHTASDARAEPWVAVPAVAALAHAEQVSMTEQCAVRGLRIDGGQLSGVFTERGPISCSQVVVAAGAWSSLLLRHHGFSIPQLTVRETVARTTPLPSVLDGNAVDEQLAFRRRADGGYTLALSDYSEHMLSKDSFRHFRTFFPLFAKNYSSTPLSLQPIHGHPGNWSVNANWDEDQPGPFEAMRILNPTPNWKSVERMRERFAARFPQLDLPPVQNAWAGMLDTMPDIVPVIDRLPEVSGVIIATGMSGHGMGIGPGVGHVVAQMLCNEKPAHDITRFRYARFGESAPLKPGPHL